MSFVSDHAESSDDLEGLLDYLKATRGFDFSAYKRTTLSRRIEKRLQAVGVETYDAYQDYLEVHQEEFQSLFNTILINVTSFFRDPEAWSYVERKVIPAMLARKENLPVRVWVAGCASGEEACTVAMLLAEALGPEAFRSRVKIYATDLDDEALASSRASAYSEKDLEKIPAALRDRYFERANGLFAFDRDLRRSIIFGRHDLVLDAPISRVDLLFCRNTLMYFNAEVQDQIFQRFHFALNDSAYLVLGRAETVIAHNDLYHTEDLKNRVFSKIPQSSARRRGFMINPAVTEASRVEASLARLRDAGFDAAPVAQIVVDAGGRVAQANEHARSLFAISRSDLGLPLQDLDVSFRPVELRSGVERALSQKRAVRHKDVAWTAPSGKGHAFDVTVQALHSDAGDVLGTSVAFEDVTALKQLRGDLQNFRQELETAYEEVQSTNEELQTTNEELQSTVEELETTNEELQSTNEELETMNEETQSANEELETINEELRLRSIELSQANAFMQSILGSLRDGVIVLDSDLQVLAWNFQSEDLWGLRADEVMGRHLLNLDIGLPVEGFRNTIRACVASGEPQQIEVEAINRRGRKVSCTVDFTPLRGNYEDGRGVIILTACMPAEDRDAETRPAER